MKAGKTEPTILKIGDVEITAIVEAGAAGNESLLTKGYFDSLVHPFTESLIAYVDKNGDDTKAVVGDPTQPYNTIQAAVDAMEALSTADRYMLYVAGGVYSEAVTVTGSCIIQARGNVILTGCVVTASVAASDIYFTGIVTSNVVLAGDGEIRYSLGAMLHQSSAITHTLSGPLRIAAGGYIYCAATVDFPVPVEMLAPGSIQGAQYLTSSVSGAYYDVDAGRLTNLTEPVDESDATSMVFVKATAKKMAIVFG
jgi:hypothetical protein